MAKTLSVSINKEPRMLAFWAIIIGLVGWLFAIIPYVGILLGLTSMVLAIVASRRKPSTRLWIVAVIVGFLALMAGLLFTGLWGVIF